jgi:membrane protein DedA with SNARE-associated domain
MSRSLSWLIAGFVALTIANFVGMALAPTLLTYHPLLLVALNPIDRHMVLAASVTPLVPFLAVTAGRRTLSCALGYGFGQHYGEGGLHWLESHSPRLGRFVLWTLRGVKRASPILILLAPSTALCGVVGGAARVSFPWFLLLATLGQLIWARLAYQLSSALAAWLLPITAFLRDHVLATTLVCIALVALYGWRKRNQPAFPLPKPPAQPIAPAESSSDP